MAARTIVVSIQVQDGPAIKGRGLTISHATADCIEKVTRYLMTVAPHLELGEEIILPLSEAGNVPEETPDGYALVVAMRSSHVGGVMYAYRYLAIRPGRYTFDDKGELCVTETPCAIRTRDSHSVSLYVLPLGSLQYKGGKWVPVEDLEY